MSVRALSEYTRIAKYAKYIPEKKRRETWEEQVERVFNMHRVRYASVLDKIEPYIELAEKMVVKKRFLGAQRVLQYGGDPILKKNERLYNCTVSFIDRARFFQEAMFLLLCGCGIGFSVQHHHIEKLPLISKRTKAAKTYVIPDSIEGWADAVGVLMSSYFMSDNTFPEFKGHKVVFDYSQIRPAGAPISSGAKAPGPDALKRSLELIEKVLEARLAQFSDYPTQVTLRPIDAYDVVMHASDAVISGGIRRSATICLFSPDDKEMAGAKTGNWFIENPQRGRSNNSALLIRGKVEFADFQELMKSVREFGEPGFVWGESTEVVYNPCVEIGMWPVDVTTGLTGWQFCNLCEMNMKKCKTKQEFLDTCRGAAILGTLQAGYAHFPYLGEVTERIVKREALLGVSMTGMMDSPDIAFNPELQREGAELIKKVNAEVAALIGINPAARTTCVKPAGSTSCMLGTASGIHPHHATRYFRRVQANYLELPVQFFEAYNPRAVEKSVWDPNGVTKVITFLCEVPDGSKTKNHVDALTLLEHVKLTQQNWVEYGTNHEANTQPWLRHNVSNTINVKDDEWDDVTNFIFDNQKFFAGISILPHSGDKDYPQAPFCSVPTASEILKEYGEGSLMASGLIVDGHAAFNHNLWEACTYALGIATLEAPAVLDSPDFLEDDKEYPEVDMYFSKLDWVRRAKQFAERYFEGNVRKMTYCLKDVYNLKVWIDLEREYQDVEWTDLREEIDNTKFEETIACSGGRCELT